jgi:hypothetical protein
LEPFWPIFDSLIGVNIRSLILTPIKESKTRLKRAQKPTEADLMNTLLEIHKKMTDSGHNGAAMIIEEIEGGRHYRCSDIFSHEKDLPFNDIVFTVKKVKAY